MIVFPDPVADTIVPRTPSDGTDDLAGNPTHRRKAAFWATWCSRSRIPSISPLLRCLLFRSLRKSPGRREGRDGHRTVIAHHDPLGKLRQD
ncbi:hypothetical protein, partial [Streptomyces prasinus]|uniref:hypothetical protein n=1 Tax=Streptomyces prasinus TaxID=67345 RepID=UPI0036355D34